MSEGNTAGKAITCKAAVCHGVNQPMVIETIEVAPPKAGEVRFKVLSTGVCHSDLSLWKGRFPFPLGPIILGHEGVGQVESVGEGVTTLKPGDYMIPLWNSQCGKCSTCANKNTNLCKKPLYFGNSNLDDGTSRFSMKDGKTVYHLAYCSTFSQYSVTTERHAAKINPKAPMDKICLVGCCIPTGYGAAQKIAQVKPGSTCAVWGLGAIGLSVVMGCKNAGASRIIGVDVNPDKEAKAREFGCTDFVNPLDHKKPIVEVLMGMTDGEGLDFTFECIGNADCATAAISSCKKGFGVSVMVGLVDPSKPVPGVSLLALLDGRTWKGTFAGGYKGLEDYPQLVEEVVAGKIKLNELVTHTMPLEKINEAFQLLIDGKSIRTILLPWSS